MGLVDSRLPVLFFPFFMSCEVMEFAEGAQTRGVSISAGTFIDGAPRLRLECEKSIELTASSHRSCLFCSSRESRDEAALSESFPTGSRKHIVSSTTTWDTLFSRNSSLLHGSWHAFSMFIVSGGGHLSTDSSLRTQKRFHSVLREFKRFTGSLQAETVSLSGVMREGRSVL